MRIFNLARNPSRYLRILFAVLALSFWLDGIAHAGHTHDPKLNADTHTVLCGYCAAFHAVADAPVHALPVYSATVAFITPALSASVYESDKPRTSALPRAPPYKY